ncbi:HAD-IIA family hydrolase [Xanthobacter pseudotagetidis]|uniref:HAD-IIA family hydrolase n=1 Tax=Xanthobacter pseudotagetidis TaxID=3119911 RepID=UPI003726F76F
MTLPTLSTARAPGVIAEPPETWSAHAAPPGAVPGVDGRAAAARPVLDAGDARAVLAAARGILFDLDGTLIRTDEVIDGAREVLAAYGQRAMILSNNSSDSAEGLSLRLARAGLDVAAPRIVLAGVETVRAVAALRPGARTMMLASAALVCEARALGLHVGDERPDVVLVARTPAFDYAALERAANAIRAGAEFVVANPDTSHPGAFGRLVPETGALAAAIAAAAGTSPARVFGKPEPDLFRAALGRLGLAAGEVVMVGDNPDTDGAGARRLGIPHILIGEGLPLRALLG